MRAAIAILVLSLVATSCSNGSEPDTSTAPRFDPSGNWTLVSGTVGADRLGLVPGWPVLLTIEAGRIQGVAPCNSFGGELTVTDGRVAVSNLSQTERACGPDVMDLEARFLGGLGRVTLGRITDGLELEGADTLLVFERVGDVPLEQLTEIEWELTSIRDADGADQPAAPGATLVLTEDGVLSGSTGCRDLSGEFVMSAGRVVTTSLAAIGECGLDLADQDGSIIAVLEGFRAEVSGGTLTLVGEGGEALTYAAAGG